ncbi:hypothetical protein QR680_008705 [Steinernema hermaphroditum]|uniref:TNase-like domain-containing protein n=1 Tax=Steinernema hermaphroditum TaxID=289476 RepID=A0AA39IJW3_9BILA|nr:hypothetical protein QR680_008705 [Steinernema hermaphroditum]
MSASGDTPLSPRKTTHDVEPIDKYNALIVRGAIVGTGLIGFGLFLRNSRIFAKFQNVNQIPKDFVRKELELKGHVREVLPSGELKVEHKPIVSLPRLWPRSKKQVGLLHLRLAGLDLSKSGQQYLAKDLRLKDKAVVFTVIKPTDGNIDSVDCDVTVRKNLISNVNLNVDLVRKGYARVPGPDQPNHLKALQSVAPYSRLVSRLLMSEKVADRRGVGVWERDTWVESVASYPTQITQIVKSSAIIKLLVLGYHVGRDSLLTFIKVCQYTFHVLIASVNYVADGYRRFGRSVDRLTSLYHGRKQKKLKNGPSS